MISRITLLAVPVAAAIFGSAAQVVQPACRNYPAESTRSGSGASTEVCDYNTNTNLYTCTLTLAQPARRIVSTRQYASAADFVDEIRVVPGVSRAKSGTTTYSPTGPGAQNSTITFLYDAERRQTGIDFQFADKATKSVYSAWDASGRPTAVTTGGQSLKYRFDDARRTLTITNVTSGGTQVHTFDVNGNLIREDIAPPGGGAVSTTVTVNRTARVCR